MSKTLNSGVAPSAALARARRIAKTRRTMSGAGRVARPWIGKADNPMNRYAFVFRGGAVVRKELAPAELGAHLQKWMVWVAELVKEGKAEPNGPRLELSGKTIRGKSKAVTDGPFAEAKDFVTGMLVVNAPTLEAATEIAKDCPIYEYDGSVEVRPIFEKSGA
jgi:hypothetical protein